MHQTQLTFNTKKRCSIDITDDINAVIASAGYQQGLCNLFIQHTSASLIVCENADPQVRDDLETFMQSIVKDGDPMFKHTMEGDDDMPAHVRTMLTESSLMLPVTNEQLALGTWQGIYLWEHRQHSFKRKILITLL